MNNLADEIHYLLTYGYGQHTILKNERNMKSVLRTEQLHFKVIFNFQILNLTHEQQEVTLNQI